MASPIYADFLGTWILDPTTCNYQQGDPPTSGLCSIEEAGPLLNFLLAWTDLADEHHEVEFSGQPNNVPAPFNGGDLADAMVIHAVSDSELNTSALYQGKERMVAQRQLDSSRQVMRITSVVRFEGGGHLANVGLYRRRMRN